MDEKVSVTILKDGPIMILGDIKLVQDDGKTISEPHRCYLCRCGASKSKPHCDGSHQKIGFKG